MGNRSTLTAALLLCCLNPAQAATAAENALRGDVAAVIDLFYGNEFKKAAAAADQLEARHPGHPVGPLFRAIVAYQSWAAEGLKNENAWADVERNLRRAEDAAQKLAAQSPAESDYYLGATLGFRARGLAARHRFLSALSDASSSLKHLKKALAKDPTLVDARLGLGMYHYFSARMPLAAKPLARLIVGESGDRERGLAELWSVANSSGAARMEARAVLSMIFSKTDEANWREAETLLAELMTRYPRNPIYRLRRVYVAERLQDWERALALAGPDEAWLSELHPAQSLHARAWSLYRAAEIHLLQGHWREAKHFLDALQSDSAPKGLRDWIDLRRKNLEESRRGLPLKSREPAPFFAGY